MSIPNYIATNIILFAISLLPFTVSAMGGAANAMCNPVIPACPCGTVPSQNGCTGGTNWYMCKGYCKETKNGRLTTGTCTMPNYCDGSISGTSQGMGGAAESLGMLNSIMGIMKGIMDMAKGSGGGGGSGGAVAASPTGSTECAQYYQVTTPSTDPCATYVPPVSGSLGTAPSTDLLGALGDSTGGNTAISDLLANVNNGSETGAATTSGAASPGVNPDLSTSTRLASGLRGDIVVRDGGSTVIGGNRDAANNVEVAGFYGADNTAGSLPTSVAARICASRPWAESLVTYVLPAAFFDSLCTWRGYEVGAPKMAVTTTDAAVAAPKPKAAPATTTPVVDNSGPAGAVKIWAVPASVSVGSRTSVFWNTSNVRECTVTSPDGSFNEKSLSGGASTVPLVSATIYSISCIGLDGNPATSSVTVKMAI